MKKESNSLLPAIRMSYLGKQEIKIELDSKNIENLVLEEKKKIWCTEEDEAIKNSMGAYEGKAEQVAEMCYSGLSLEMRALIKILAKLLV